MKVFFTIALNLVFILGFFLFSHQKNKNLMRQLDKIENNIKSKQNIRLAVQNFKAQQQQILLQNKNVSELEPLKTQALNFVLGLINELPLGISLMELTKQDRTFVISGKTALKQDLRTFVNLRHLKLLKSKRRLFEASGKI